MARTGRPKLPKAKGNREVIIFRLSKEENRQIDAAVRATEHKNKSRWIREALLKAAGRSQQKRPISESAGEN